MQRKEDWTERTDLEVLGRHITQIGKSLPVVEVCYGPLFLLDLSDNLFHGYAAIRKLLQPPARYSYMQCKIMLHRVGARFSAIPRIEVQTPTVPIFDNSET
jgi:hypothetical protein